MVPPSRRLRALLLGASLAGLGGCGGGGEDGAAAHPAGSSPGGSAQAPPPASPGGPSAPGSFADEAAARGLLYVNVSGEAGKPDILGANGAGVALLDLHGDGDLDVVFGQGLASLADFAGGGGATLEVFTNDGAGRFARAEPPARRGWWTGLAAGDVDGDGDADLVAGAYGDLAVFAQGPDGALVHAEVALPAEEPHPEGLPWWTTSLALLDADRDGALDLYVGRYLDLDPADPPRGELGEGALALPCWWKGLEVYCGPRGMTAQPDRLLRGSRSGATGGAFTDATATWLPDHAAGFTLAVGAFDADSDGDTDLYVANDSTANLMLVNEVLGEAGSFVDRGLTAGVAVNPDGLAEAGMGVGIGDVDRDGRLDLAVTNFSDEPTQLYFASPQGFTNQTYALGLAHASRRLLSWSAHLVDFDGDGWLELFTANGHVYPQADAEGTGTSYAQPDTLWRIGPGDRVRAVEPPGAGAGSAPTSILAIRAGTRGTAVGDVDGDGAPDLVGVTIDGPAYLGINRLGPGARRVVVRCVGDPATPGNEGLRSSTDALGARLVLVPKVPAGTPEYALLGEVRTAEGYQSSSSPEVHFGLGESEEYASLQVFWPSGRVTELGPGATGRRLVIREGAGLVEEVEL